MTLPNFKLSTNCVECEHYRISGKPLFPHSHNTDGEVVYNKDAKELLVWLKTN